jgi:tripartite-type tricarboxylate transporter receptor subunit TctC
MQPFNTLFVKALLSTCVSLGMSAQALEYPLKPITIVVGFSAGGSSDVIARIVADKLSAGWGQPVGVESRAGVGSIVGAAYVSLAQADGD